MKTIVKYDLWYLQRTSKFIVIGMLGVLLTGMSVLTARFMNEIMAFAFKQEGLEVPLFEDPTAYDSYVQFYGNFTQIFLLVLLFVSIAYFTFDSSRGHYPLIFSKPFDRKQYVLIKSILISLTVLVALVVSGLFFSYYTIVLFDGFEWGKFWLSLLIYYIFLLLILHVGLYFSMLLKSYMMPVVYTLIIFFGFSILTTIDFGFLQYMPWNLVNVPLEMLANELTVGESLVSAVIGVALIAVLLILSMRTFKNKELI